jgi:hypothetical protein
MSPILASALGWSVFHTLMLLWPMGQIAVQMAIPIMMAAAPGLLAAAAGLGALGALGAGGAELATEATPPLPVTGGAAIPLAAGGVVPAGAEVCACADPISSPGTAATGNVSAGMPGGGAAGGGPGVGFGPTSCLYLISSVSSSARQSGGAKRSRGAGEEASESQGAPGEAEALALAAKRRRRQRAQQRGFGDEYMDMNIGVTPDWDQPPNTGASDSGAGPLGFAGTATAVRRKAAGITVLTGEGLDTEPRIPMLPGSWSDEPS